MKFWLALEILRQPGFRRLANKLDFCRGIPFSFFPLFFIATSCASVGVHSGEGLAALTRNTEKRSAVSGNLLITSDLKGRSVTAPAVLMVEWPNKLRLELQDPVGGLLTLLVMNDESFWLYESSRAELLTGPVKKLPFGLIPHLSATDLVRIFLARPQLERFRRGAPSGGVESGPGRALFTEQGLRETLTWSESAEPLEWSRTLSDQISESAFYEDYEAKSGLRYPTKIRLVVPGPEGGERRILLAWRDWDPSVPQRKNLFQIPQQQTFGRKIKVLP